MSGTSNKSATISISPDKKMHHAITSTQNYCDVTRFLEDRNFKKGNVLSATKNFIKKNSSCTSLNRSWSRILKILRLSFCHNRFYFEHLEALCHVLFFFVLHLSVYSTDSKKFKCESHQLSDMFKCHFLEFSKKFISKV